MKPRPRIGTMIRWGGAVVTVSLIAMWIVSGWWSVGVAGNTLVLEIGYGQARLFDSIGVPTFQRTPSGPPETYASRHPWEVRWRPLWDRNNFPFDEYACPLWIPAIGAGLLTLLAWRRNGWAHHRLDRCVICGYDRTGLARDVKCPECGTDGSTPA